MLPPASFRLDADPGGDYPKGLYAHVALNTGGLRGGDAVTETDITAFHERGYLVVPQTFTAEDVASSLQAIQDLIAGTRPDFAGVQFEHAVRDRIDELTTEERQDSVRKLMWFVDYDDRLRAIAEHPAMLVLLQRLIGHDALTMFQDMALVKPPRIGREKPWHQDMPYFPLVIVFGQKYQKDLGIGTLIGAMPPYSIAFGIASTIVLIAWVLLGLPLGPGAPLEYVVP